MREGGERGMTHVYDDLCRSWYLVFVMFEIVFVVLILLRWQSLQLVSCHKYNVITSARASRNKKKSSTVFIRAVFQ